MDTRSLGPPPTPTATSPERTLSLSLGPQQKPAVSGTCSQELSQLRWGAHQTNRREQNFAFCSGLVFTSGDTASILLAKADTDRGHPAQEVVGLLLLLEVQARMLETGSPAGPLGRSLRTPASESGVPLYARSHLPGLRNRQSPPLRHPLCAAAATGLGWIQHATCGAAGP